MSGVPNGGRMLHGKPSWYWRTWPFEMPCDSNCVCARCHPVKPKPKRKKGGKRV